MRDKEGGLHDHGGFRVLGGCIPDPEYLTSRPARRPFQRRFRPSSYRASTSGASRRIPRRAAGITKPQKEAHEQTYVRGRDGGRCGRHAGADRSQRAAGGGRAAGGRAGRRSRHPAVGQPLQRPWPRPGRRRCGGGQPGRPDRVRHRVQHWCRALFDQPVRHGCLPGEHRGPAVGPPV